MYHSPLVPEDFKSTLGFEEWLDEMVEDFEENFDFSSMNEIMPMMPGDAVLGELAGKLRTMFCVAVVGRYNIVQEIFDVCKMRDLSDLEEDELAQISFITRCVNTLDSLLLQTIGKIFSIPEEYLGFISYRNNFLVVIEETTNIPSLGTNFVSFGFDPSRRKN